MKINKIKIKKQTLYLKNQQKMMNNFNQIK